MTRSYIVVWIRWCPRPSERPNLLVLVVMSSIVSDYHNGKVLEGCSQETRLLTCLLLGVEVRAQLSWLGAPMRHRLQFRRARVPRSRPWVFCAGLCCRAPSCLCGASSANGRIELETLRRNGWTGDITRARAPTKVGSWRIKGFLSGMQAGPWRSFPRIWQIANWVRTWNMEPRASVRRRSPRRHRRKELASSISYKLKYQILFR